MSGSGNDRATPYWELSNPLILDKIFSQLGPADIKTVAQVSSSWRSVVEVPKFWSWVRVSLSVENFDQIFSSRRFLSINTVTLCKKDKQISKPQMATFFSGLEDSALTNLYCNWVGLASVDAETLARVVVRVKTMMMVGAFLTCQQVHLMFKAIAESEELKLANLNIDCNDLSQLPPSLLAQALVRLEKADLFCTRLTSAQVEAILDTIILARQRGDLKLKSLNIMRGDVSTLTDSKAQQVKRILRLFFWK